ncbi:MAG TPA: peptidyl-prolyl cis-trans isomerase [Chthoniobacterales bacterium]
MKLCSAVVLAGLFAATPMQGAGPEVIDGIAAIVNNDVITFSQVQEVSSSQEQSLRQQYSGQELVDKVKESRLAALRDLVDRQLVLQEFKKKDFHLPDYVVEDHVQEIIRQDFQGDRQAFVRTLSAQGYSLNRFRDNEKDKIIVQAMRQSNVKGNFTASPQKIEAYYNANKNEFATPEQIKLRLIVLNADPADSNGGSSTRQMADEIQRKAKDGADFATLAKTYSMDGTAENGGDWGWVDQKTLNQELTNVAFALAPNQVSQVVQIGDSYYILYCEAKKPSSFMPLQEVKDGIQRKLEQVQRQQAAQRWLDGLREKAYIKIF